MAIRHGFPLFLSCTAHQGKLMADLYRFGISLEKPLIEAFDRHIASRNYRTVPRRSATSSARS
jgi:hypothetical protein